MSVLIKLGAGGLLLFLVGVPVVETWEALFLAAAWMAVVFATARTDPRRLVAAATIAFAVVGVRQILPRADISEGHNAFLVASEGEALQRGLPPAFGSQSRPLDGCTSRCARSRRPSV